MNGRERPEPQGAFCPECGRYCHLLIDGRLTVHTSPDDRYGPACPRQLPALPRRLAINTAPLKVMPIATCRGCGKRAPWCSCGAMDYHPRPGGDR